MIFTGGFRGKDLLQTDLNGAVKLMIATEQASSKRFVHLSSAFAQHNVDQKLLNVWADHSA